MQWDCFIVLSWVSDCAHDNRDEAAVIMGHPGVNGFC